MWCIHIAVAISNQNEKGEMEPNMYFYLFSHLYLIDNTSQEKSCAFLYKEYRRAVLLISLLFNIA